MNIIPNLPILHSKKTVGKFIFTRTYLQSLILELVVKGLEHTSYNYLFIFY